MSSVATGIEKVGFYTDDEGYNEGESFTDCNDDLSICEGDEGWAAEMGNNVIDVDEEFINSKIDTVDYKTGVIHNFGVSYTDKIFRWFSVKPTISLKESWIFKYKEYDIDNDETFSSNYNYNKSFKRRLSGSLSISTSTKLYGVIPFSVGKLNSFRHVVSPSLTFRYSPDLSNNSSLFQINSLGEKRDYFSGSLVGSTPTSKSRRYSISIRNDFQAKVLAENDNYQKIDFLNWTLNTSYNPDADSLGWADISSSVRAKFPTLSNITMSMRHDPYRKECDDQGICRTVDKFESFPRLTYISASTDINLVGNKFNYNNNQNINLEDTLDFDEKIDLSQSLDPYEPTIENSRVWDMGLRFQYSLRENSSSSGKDWTKTFWTNLNLNINLSSSWKMAYSARFDIEENEIVNHSIYLFRPLHCWEFSFKWWPTGSRQGFLLNIYIKNPDLRDVKLKSTGGSFFGL